jgi:hypothetical protein
LKQLAFILGFVSLLALSSESIALAQQEVAREPSPFLTLLVGWFPVIILLLLWWWVMRRSGVGKNSAYMDRGHAHMDRVEQQNDEIIAALDRIEKALGRRG